MSNRSTSKKLTGRSLKHCPYCSNRGSIKYQAVAPDTHVSYVECPKCKFRTRESIGVVRLEAIEEAISIWNSAVKQIRATDLKTLQSKFDELQRRYDRALEKIDSYEFERKTMAAIIASAFRYKDHNPSLEDAIISNAFCDVATILQVEDQSKKNYELKPGDEVFNKKENRAGVFAQVNNQDCVLVYDDACEKVDSIWFDIKEWSSTGKHRDNIDALVSALI